MDKDINYLQVLKKYEITDTTVLDDKTRWKISEFEKIHKNPMAFDKNGNPHPITAKKLAYLNEDIIEGIFIYLQDQEELSAAKQAELDAAQAEANRLAEEQTKAAEESLRIENEKIAKEKADKLAKEAAEKEKKKLKPKWELAGFKRK